MKVVGSLARVGVLAGLAAIAVADPVPKPWFTMRKRVATWAKQSCRAGTVAKELSYSELNLFHDGEAEERTWNVPACANPRHAWDWKVPTGSKVRKLRIRPEEYQRFKRFLDDPNVRRLTSFLNAGPGVGDYEFEIRHASGDQRISVVSLMPDHIELSRNSTLLRLICDAKQLTHLPVPKWCALSDSERR